MNDTKRRMRSLLIDRRAQLDADKRCAIDSVIINRVLDLPDFQKCSRIFIYASVGIEINTRDLINIAYEQGKTVALPKSESGGNMDFFEYTGSFITGKFNIPEPTSERILYPAKNDLMIVPGLAFTPEGHRIGYGGGYYDRYLAKHPCRTIGLCREEFLLKELPVAWNDLAIDCVITESHIIGK